MQFVVILREASRPLDGFPDSPSLAFSPWRTLNDNADSEQLTAHKDKTRNHFSTILHSEQFYTHETGNPCQTPIKD